MGKETRKSSRRHNIHPTLGSQVNSGIQVGTNEQMTLQPDQVLPVVEKLSSLDSTERGWAAACISNLALASPSNLKILLSKGIVGSLIKLLSDNAREVVEEALGTLRNLCAVDPDICNEYFVKDIMTPLTVLLPQISQIIDLVLKDAPLVDAADQDRRASIWDVAENYIYIIWGLVETSDKCIKAVNQLNIVDFLISFLSAAGQCPTKVVIAAGQCLTTLTDDNKEVNAEFQNRPEYAQMLFNILSQFENTDDNKLLVCVLACAILMNVRDVLPGTDALGNLNKTALPILIASLNYNIQKAAQDTKHAIDSGNVTKHEDTLDITPKPKQPLTKEDVYIQTVEHRLTTLQLSLELLSNICSQDDAEDDGWEDADENMDEDEAAEDMTDNVNEDNVDEYLRDAEKFGMNTSAAVDEEAIRSNPVLATFTNSVYPKLLELSTPTALSYSQDTSFGVAQALTLTHQRALECLNNFLLAMNEIPTKFWFKEHLHDAQKTWGWLFSMANTVASVPSSEQRDNILEIIIGCLWALGRGLGDQIPLEASHVPSLCGAYHVSPNESMKVKIVGSLGPIASRQGDINTNKDVGVFIMEVLSNITSQKTQPDVAVEALNFIFDVYSDCAFDYDEPVFIQGNFNSQLKKILPAFRSMVKSTDRRKNFDLRNRCDEALMNLVAFIKYKDNEKRQ